MPFTDLHRRDTATAGFSLVELAISVTIIGILIAGVVKGQDVMDNARIVAVASELNRYESAAVSFRDLYDALPGDISTARTDIIGCNDANFCTNGDGNGAIGIYSLTANEMMSTDQTGSSGTNGEPETTQFWKHLALAGLIESVNPGADPDAPEWGVTHPGAAFKGGYQITHGTHVSVSNAMWFYLRKNVTGRSYVTSSTGANVMSPLIAKSLDRKIDDGDPDYGIMQQPDNGTCDNNYPEASDPRVYLPSSSKDCAPVFRVRF